MRVVELKPIKEDLSDYDEVERIIRELLRKEIYAPLMRILNYSSRLIRNSTEDLIEAIQTGQITFYRGVFKGRFNARVSRELARIGAKWDRRQGVFKVPASSLPSAIRQAIRASEAEFTGKLESIDEHLKKLLPEEIADKLKVGKLFDMTLWKVDRDFRKSIEGISVAPQLSDARRKKLADEWQNNLKLYIKDWSKEEIVKLRKSVQKSVFTGNRNDQMAKVIENRYKVSKAKAKFLARQETSLLMTKFKETRYVEAGVNEYRWGVVAGSPKHPVRFDHKKLEGTIQRWNDPPITDSKTGARNNPGQDFNCRCFARPIVRFK